MFLSATLARNELFDLLWDFLTEHKFINQDIKNLSLYKSCSNNKSLEIVNKLIDFGADVNIVLEEGTPLRVASELGNLDIVIKLVESGVQVDYQDAEQFDSAVRLAVDERQWHVVEYLLPFVRNHADKQYAKRKIPKVKLPTKKDEKKSKNLKCKTDNVNSRKSKRFIFNIIESQSSEFEWRYIDLEEGTGERPKCGQKVIFDYSSFLEDGTKLLMLKKIGIILCSDFVSRSLDEAIISMKIGGSKRIFIPLVIAKSTLDPIPNNAKGEYLICDIKLHKVIE
jgi:FKBP-type peptidyl-prolyl cis-trans isomerase